MSLRSNIPVRYNSREHRLTICGPDATLDIHDDGAGSFFAHLDDVRDSSATQMGHALARSSMGLAISDIERSFFDYEYSPATTIDFEASSDGLTVNIGFFLDDSEDEAAVEEDVVRTVEPLMNRIGWGLRSAELDPRSAASPWLWRLTLEPSTRGKSLGEVYDQAEQILSLVEAATGQGLRRETVLDLLRVGRADVLIGQPEGPWLDVKSQDYELSSERGKISIAQDVARFANAEAGGLVVIGMGAKKLGDGEYIRDVRPVPLDGKGVLRHRQAIDARVFPPPDDLGVEQVAVGKGRLIILHVPPQPEELKPFLVQGAIVDGRVEGAFISILRRRGEESIPISAAAIHASLAAGRALLRRGELPNETAEPRIH